MKPIHTQTEIAAPPPVVWSYVRDPDKFAEWMTGLESYEKTNDVRGVGETFRMGIKRAAERRSTRVRSSSSRRVAPARFAWSAAAGRNR